MVASMKDMGHYQNAATQKKGGIVCIILGVYSTFWKNKLGETSTVKLSYALESG